MKIMFVCTGNICRSPLAEAVFVALARKQGVADRFDVASSGTTAYHVGQEADERMRAVAARRGVTIRHSSQQLTRADLEKYDLVLAMDQSNVREIGYLAGTSIPHDNVKLLREFDPGAEPGAEVPDPYYGGRAGFEKVYVMVERTCKALLLHLLDQVPAPFA